MQSVDKVDTTLRRAVAAFDRHSDAESYVDHLAERGFPVERVIIVGREPVVVERVVGRLDPWRAAGGGALSGTTMGLLLGWLFALFFAHDGTSLVAILLYWLLVGAAIGAALGLLSYYLGGRRGFVSTSSISARRYEVMVDHAYADEALRLGTSTLPGQRGTVG